MVLRDLDGGHIAAVSYDSNAPIERTLRSFAVNLTGNPAFSDLLNQARGFVEVPAGTAGFVMVTTLPADVKAVDAEPDHLAQFSDTTTASANQSGALTQEELAQLLTSGDTTRIREALPRMSPQMRRVAETVLAESAQRESDRE